MMFKIIFLLVSITGLTNCYNYGENQPQATYSAELPQQQQIRSNSFLNRQANDRWTNGYNQPADNQDGSYLIRPQLRSTTLQRNINFRSNDQQSNLRSNGGPNLLSSTGLVNADVAASTNERSNNQRLLSTISNASGLSRTSGSGPNTKDVSATIPVQKNEATSQVQANGALPLSQLSRLRPQSHGSSPYYHSETLEQMINRRSADKFLGPLFIHQQLNQQKGEDKFLRVYGKEERELNGTIEVKKGGLVNANLEEVKDGRFSVMDKDNHKVGDVNLHRDVEKHLKMTENNGVTNVELEKNSNAELNVERDINLVPRFRYAGQFNDNTPNPSHKVRVHLEQNQNSRANVEISKNQIHQTTLSPNQNNNNNSNNDRDNNNNNSNNNNGRNNGRYRRDINLDSQLSNLPLSVRY